MTWINRARITPYAHQIVGVDTLVRNPYFLLADDMGAGKTKQTIDAALAQFVRGEIDRVIVVAPAAVRDVWFDPELGELAKHLWDGVHCLISRYHQTVDQWTTKGPNAVPFRWIITNYEFIRGRGKDLTNLHVLLKFCGPKTKLVLDESSLVKAYDAAQTKACLALRGRCGAVLLLNGTPIANSPKDMYSQGKIMHPAILECRGITAFMARYAVMGGFIARTKWGNHPTQVLRWINLDDLQRRFAPYTLRRLKKDCLDLPEKLPPVAMTVKLTPATWKVYTAMKGEMVAWLGSGVATASQAMVQSIRLSQITSGFVGGIETLEDDSPYEDEPAWIGELFESRERVVRGQYKELGTEKLELFLDWLAARLEEDLTFKVLVWSRFRWEVLRAYNAIRAAHPGIAVGRIWGKGEGYEKGEREAALRLLDPRTAPATPVVVVGTPSTGAMGLNLTAASTVVYLSNDYSLKTRLQSEDRVHRPGQTKAVSYFDVVAVGPKGQKTIDALILKALYEKKNLAEWTTSAWIQALETE